MIFIRIFLLIILVSVLLSSNIYSQSSSSLISKRGGVAFRTDDNQAISKYLEYASIFNKYNQKFTFAINLGLQDYMTAEYLNGIRQMRASGHEMMDHTPHHRTNLFRTILSPDYFINYPGVHRISDNKIELKHAPVEISSAKRSGYADVSGNIVTVTNGIFSSYSKFDCYLYFPSLNQLVYINEYSGGWIDSNTVKVQDVWTNSINLGSHQNIKFYNFDINNVHITSDAIKALAEESLRLANYYGLERPITWIQPGGYHPQVYSNEVKEGLSGNLGYKAAGTFNGTSLKVFNEYNSGNNNQFGMSWGDFREEGSTLEDCKKTIADRVAKHHVVFGASHFNSTLGGWSGFLDRTEKLIQWCVANNIPIKTYSEWSDILYRQTPDPSENIFPPLNVDLDGNNKPDGHNSNVGGILDKTDGYPLMNDYCFTTTKAGWIFSIGDLAGIEKGDNDFEIWTKGAPGNFIEVIFKLKTSFWSGTQDFVYKFPAENPEWTYYNLAQSINGNTSLHIPSNVSLMDVIVQCSNYSSGKVKVSGMKFAKFLGTGDYLSVSPSNQSVIRNAGSTNFFVSSNVNWAASGNESWLSISPASGTNNGTITADFTENTSTSQRVGTITINGGGITRTVTVTQVGIPISLTITPYDRPVSYIAGSTTFSVTSNTSWTVSDDASWLSVSPSSGSNNGTITADFTENTSTSQRVGTITITGGGITRTVTVTQAAVPFSPTVTPSDRPVSYTAGNTTFSVTSNTSWTVSGDATWLSVSPSSGSNNGTITATYTDNTNTVQRTAAMTITGGGITRTVTVTQAAVPFSLTVTPSDRPVSYTAGNTTFSVTSNTSWTVSDDATWLSVSPSSGSNNGTITATYTDNTNTVQRAAAITLNGGGITKTVTVTQAAKPYNLSLSPSDRPVHYSAGSTTFSVTSNTSWSVNDNADWLTISPSNGSNDVTINATYTENPDTIQRAANITLTGGGLTRTATVTQESTPSLTVTPSEKYIGYTEDSTTFTITSNRSWTAEDDADWITVTPASGTNDGTINVTYLANPNTTERVGTITVTGGGISRTVIVTQESTPSLAVEPSERFVSNAEGNTEFTVISNRSWTVADDADWITVSPTNGTNDGTISVTYTANPSTTERVGTITITVGGISRTVTVTQESTPSLAVEPSERFVPNAEGSTEFTVISNREWAAEDDADWITITPTNGTNDGTISVTYLANSNTTERLGTITITGEGITRTVTVTQESTPSLAVEPSERFVSNAEGNTEFTVISNREWTAEDYAEWLTAEPTAGPNDGTLTVRYSQNTDTVERVGIITIAAEGLTRTAVITQAAADYLSISPLFLELPADANTAKLLVTSNIAWQLNEDASWINLEKYSGSNSDTISLVCNSNEKNKPRLSKITINGENILREVNVLQMPTNSRLQIAPNGKVVDADSGKINVSIESNAAWKIKNNYDWIAIEPDSGEDDNAIVISYRANKDSLLRTASLQFIADTVTLQFILDQNGLDVFDILAYPNSDTSGTTSGCRRYLFGSLANVAAIPNEGWIFKNWRENDQQVSTDSVYIFGVTRSRTLIAMFEKMTTGLIDESKIAERFELYQNYPNPFNPMTKIRYAIPSKFNGGTSKVLLKLIDVLGNEVKTLVDEEQTPGFYEVECSAEGLSSGVYIYLLRVSDFVSSKKMVILK